MFLIDLTNSVDNNKLYGGNAGFKRGITIDGSNWIIKFPQETNGFKNVDISFTTSPLSEYIGSHIYQILGYKTQDTKLGFYHNEKYSRTQIVVICKDFTNEYTKLVDYESIKNNYSDDLQEKIIAIKNTLNKGNSLDAHSVPIEEVMLQFEENEIFKNNSYVKEHFWDMLVIDCIINNNDRNKNNWGLLYNIKTDKYDIAPIYDNGASFVSKHSDEKLANIMSSEAKMNNSVLNGMCYYSFDGEAVNFKNFFKKLHESNMDKDLNDAIKRVIPNFKTHWNEIKNFINNIPIEENNLKIISNIQKEFFIKSMDIRVNTLFN